MTFDSNHFVRPDIREMEAYKPIVPFEVLSKQLGRPAEQIAKLNANENPYGPSPTALKMLQDGAFFHIYPDPEARDLRAALGDYLGMPSGRILCGMGADELIDLVLRVVLSPDDCVLDMPPTFGMYPFSTVVNAGRYLSIMRDENFEIDIDAIEQAVADNPRIKVIFACSPNNPSGNLLSDEVVNRLLALPVLVVLDEAYIEFAAVSGAESRIKWALAHDNLIVLRTFSKLAGLAGLRIGYGAFPEWIVPHVMKIKQPYNVHVAANLAALGSLQDAGWLHKKVDLLVAERNRMVGLLEEFAFLWPYPSHANFVLFKVVGIDAYDLQQQLQAHGVLVRYYRKPGIDNCIRISAGRPHDTNQLITALQKIQL